MITVFGLGFVGLTTALGFAHYGYKVYGLDVNEKHVNILRSKKVPFFEPHLETELKTSLDKSFLLENNVENAVKNSSIIFYCVGTPYGPNGEADLNYLYQAIDATLRYADKNKKLTLVIKSTVPPSTTKDRVAAYIESKGFVPGIDILLANNPEFLREGSCWQDFMQADRIVLGSEYAEAIENLKKVYQPFHIPVFAVNSNTGEYIKYLSNSILATLISYSNEMADIANYIGDIQIADAFHILHLDKRWNNCNMATYVYPGCGYGGYCLPKDTNALLAIAKTKGAAPQILENVIKTNERMPETIADRIIGNVEQGQKIGILGLSFKPNSNDVRDSSSAKIIRKLLEKGYHNIAAYDPAAIDEFKEKYKLDLEYTESLEQLITAADVFVILTAWDDFKELAKITNKKILDYRYMLDSALATGGSL